MNVPDAVIVGAGPNGLAAGIMLARAGKKVLILEANDTVGGGCRSRELTLPGFTHDMCSSIHSFVPSSPFFRQVPLKDFGAEWIAPPVALAHPFDDGSAAMVMQSLEETAAALGPDRDAYLRLMSPLVQNAEQLIPSILSPIQFPRHPLALIAFGLKAMRSVKHLSSRFSTPSAKALIAGIGAHGVQPLDGAFTAATTLALTLAAHVGGWLVAKGGSQRVSDALAKYFMSLGGEIRTGTRVRSMDDIPTGKILFDLTPRQILAIAGDALPASYRQRLDRFRFGPGVFKVDWALDSAIPWTADVCRKAGTVHVGGSFDEISSAERDVHDGKHPDRPFVIVTQPSICDPSRAPTGKHTAWGYCHVPSGSREEMTARIEDQIERFAPGFRKIILARHATDTASLERGNENYVGGDIGGGAMDAWQIFARPVLSACPYKTPHPRLFICSSSTPPGGGIHGMCGVNAAKAIR